jgi:hypothetical protein
MIIKNAFGGFILDVFIENWLRSYFSSSLVSLVLYQGAILMTKKDQYVLLKLPQ